MDDLDFAFTTRGPVLDHELALFEACLKNSKGEPSMSPEDTKLALLALQGLAKNQLELIDALRREIAELKKPKKTIFQKLFRK